MSTFSRMCGIEAFHVFVDCGSRGRLRGQQENMKEGGGTLLGLVHLVPCRGVSYYIVCGLNEPIIGITLVLF